MSKRTRLSVEKLQERAVLSLVVEFNPITEMADLAALFPAEQATNLYLNFDGWNDKGISPFETTTGNRNRDINQILFHAAEFFAPFDVKVQRMVGNGVHATQDGDSTIFIGDKESNTRTSAPNPATVITTNYVYGVTPGLDVPALGSSLSHIPNSDPFNVAYVDPVSWISINGGAFINGSSWSNEKIARVIAHEGGHTFGLAHVDSGSERDMMSYSASNRRFINEEFAITTDNNNGTEVVPAPEQAPMWLNPFRLVESSTGEVVFETLIPYPLETQNSYQYLQTILGPPFNPGDLADVANPFAVDSGYIDGTKHFLTTGDEITSGINNKGDYDVFQFSVTNTQYVQIDVESTGNLPDSVLFVFDQSGAENASDQLLYYNDDGGPGLNSRLTMWAEADKSYDIVVGAYSNNYLGGYTLSISPAEVQLNLEHLIDIDALAPATLPEPRPIQPPADESGLRSLISGLTGTDSHSNSHSHGSPAPFDDDSPVRSLDYRAVDFASFASLGTDKDRVSVRTSGSIHAQNGIVRVIGTDDADSARFHYVVEPGGRASEEPTAWIEVQLEDGSGRHVAHYDAATVSAIHFAGFDGPDKLRNDTCLPTFALGGNGDDTLIGGCGSDTLHGGGGNDLLKGEDGNDVLDGEDGDDSAHGAAGYDFLVGAAGNDDLSGGTEDDQVYGGLGSDTVSGGGGHDIVDGGDGADEVDGNGGRDFAIGGRGPDTVGGGSGQDVVINGFVTFDNPNESLIALWTEWTSDHPLGQRRRNILGFEHPQSDERLNGDHYFIEGETVQDDGDKDELFGELGGDLLFAEQGTDDWLAAPGDVVI